MELLEDFLRRDEAGALSEQELDQQLSAPPPPPPPSAKAPAPPAHAPLIPPAGEPQAMQGAEAFLARAFAKAEEEHIHAETIDTAIKAASHGVKVLAPLLTAITQWVDPATQGDQLEKIMASTLQRVGSDALKVAGAFGVQPADSPAWLTSQISGQIMEILVCAIQRNNGMVLEEKNTSYLSPLINLAKQAEGISTSFYGSAHDASWQLVNALTLASAEVMTEYHVFSYFHSDPLAVSQTITDYLNERVIEGTLDGMTNRFNLNDNERGYLGNSLLRQAGRLMANAWTRNMASTLESVKEMPIEARREVLVSGYPLDQIFNDFESMYQGLEVSALSAVRSLSPQREQKIQRAQHAPRMG